MLWVDKHRPKTLAQLTYHPVITSHLLSLSSNPSSLPHLLFYGPPGSGKRTRISCLLRSIFGAGSDRLRLDKRTFTTPTNRNVDINMVCSNHHIEMSPGDAGLDDRYVVQEVIKEMAANRSLSAGSFNNNGAKSGKIEFKVVVLVEVERLSKQAQAALRRTMEKYAGGCRLILCCNNQSKVIDPVRSRCLGIRVPAPSYDDICDVLSIISRKEHVTIPDELVVSTARESSRNLRRALLMIECSRVAGGGLVLKSDQPVQKTDWEQYIIQLAADVTKEQSPQRLLASREKLYELLINCIPASIIMKTLCLELMKNLDDSLKHEVMDAAAFYEHRIALGSKEIFHLEAFLAKYMSIYKRYLNEMFA